MKCKNMDNIGNCCLTIGHISCTCRSRNEEKPPVIQTIEAHTIGIIFQILQGDAWANIPGKLLKEGDICRLFPEREEPNEKEWILTAAPELVDEAADDWLIKLKAKEDAPATESQPAAAPQFKATDKKKMIDVECATTHSEEKIKTLVRGLQSIKAEAQADAADWRERIKTQEKALFEACNGKSFTQMECKIEEDWDAGVRRYVRPDTGEVALDRADTLRGAAAQHEAGTGSGHLPQSRMSALRQKSRRVLRSAG